MFFLITFGVIFLVLWGGVAIAQARQKANVVIQTAKYFQDHHARGVERSPCSFSSFPE